MGCTSTPNPPTPLLIPTSLLTCNEEPIPSKQDLTDQEYSIWIKDVIFAGRDCRDQLFEIKEVLTLSKEVDVTDVLVIAQKED